MPITNRSWDSFYQGTFAEHHICSLFYFYGYEAQKITPDVGVDLMVTNLARVRFKNEVPSNAELQVKSALHDANGAYVSMSADELAYLCTGENRYTVFVILHRLRGSVDPESFERGDDPDASRAVDRDMLNHFERDADSVGRELRREGKLSIHSFIECDLTRFWLHSSQMKRMLADGNWKPNTNGFGLNISLQGESVLIDNSSLICELRDIRYIVKNCRAGNRIRNGDWSFDHY